MNKHKCERIRVRLPLWVDRCSNTGLAEPNQELADLTTTECCEIARHLAECARCCEYQIALKKALTALTAVAEYSPNAYETPSLWPLIEARIAHRDTASARCGQRPIAPLAGRLIPHWINIDGTRPLCTAWVQDIVHEVLSHLRQTRAQLENSTILLVRVSIGCAICFALIAFLGAYRGSKSAESIITANSSPLTNPSTALNSADDHVSQEITKQGDTDDLVNQSTKAESSQPRETIAAEVEHPASLKTQGRTRVRYEFDRAPSNSSEPSETKPAY